MKTLLIALIAVLTFACTTEANLTLTVDASMREPDSFSTISEALEHLTGSGSTSTVIEILPGRYYEKVTVESDNITFLGRDAERTILTFDAHGDSKKADGMRCGTSGSAALTINAKNFQAVNLTIENGFDYPGNALKGAGDTTRVRNTQAVAVSITGNSDRTVFRNCVIRGYQDTFLADAGRTYVSECRVYGHVDFIFGSGQLVVENSDIISRDRPGKNPTGYITAPSTGIEDPYGMLFLECRFLKENDQVPDGSVRLGRPWHPDADLSVSGSAVFRDCFMDAHVGPEGYARISSRNEKGDRIWFEVGPDSRFFEYRNSGPGALITEKRPQLSDQAANWYTKLNVLDNWNPE